MTDKSPSKNGADVVDIGLPAEQVEAEIICDHPAGNVTPLAITLNRKEVTLFFWCGLCGSWRSAVAIPGVEPIWIKMGSAPEVTAQVKALAEKMNAGSRAEAAHQSLLATPQERAAITRPNGPALKPRIRNV